jgi:outer membrane receptor protein involved in Fe transport
LQIGLITEVVTVEGAAPMVESTTQEVTYIFDNKKIESLPLGNNLDTFALFVPGVAVSGDAGFSNANGAELSVNGQRSRSNNFQIDGQANNDNSVAGPSIFFGNQDAIAELQIVTNFSAEYGRNMGAVVNYVTKAGTNAFHGTAYEFYNGSHFDSLTNESKSPAFGNCMPGQSQSTGCTAVTVPRYVDNRFGGTVGGPIKQDQVWFFASTNQERTRSAGSPSSSGNLLTPTPTGVQQLLTLFPGNPAVNALATIGPTAVKGGNPTFTGAQDLLVSAKPGVSCSGTPPDPSCVPVQFGSMSRLVLAPSNNYEATGRVDVKLTSKDNFFARYLFQQSSSDGVAGASPSNHAIAQGDWISEPGRDQQIGLDWVRNWSANFVNQGRFSYSRAGFGFEGGAFPNCLQANITNCPTDITFGDGKTLGMGIASNLPQGRIINVYQVQDNFSWQLGKTTLKIGGDYTKQRSPNVGLAVNGLYSFPNFNSFLANTPSLVKIVSGNPKSPFKENDLAFYAQDDWRVKDNLTLNLGLRWEWFQQAINLLHDRTVAQQTGPNPFWDASLPLSRTTIPYIPQALHNFSPVVGFAWTPRIMKGMFGEDKTVLRGGFRIGYDPQFYNMFLNTATNSPVVNAGTFLATSGSLAPGLPTSGALGSDVQAFLDPLIPTGGDPGKRSQFLVAPNFHNPYSEQWSFGIQRSINQRVAAEVRYVGNHTVGNFQALNGNPALGPLIAAGFANLTAGLTPCSNSTMPGFALGYVDCTRTREILRANTAWSKYNSLQSELRFANWHGVTATASYTFSKTMDNASEVYNTVAGGNTLAFAQNPFDTSRGERGLSGIDYPNVFGLAFIYDFPFHKSDGLTGRVLGGWQLNSTYRYTTGQPYTTIESRFIDPLSNSLCDPAGATSPSYDACRPILGSPSLPLNSVGVYCDGTTASCINGAGAAYPLATVVSSSDPCFDSVGLGNTPCAVTPINGAHWIANTNAAALVKGTPFAGARRDILRGQPISTVNMSMVKNTKLTERVTVQLRVTAYNLLNTQFRGNPDPVADDVFSPFPGFPGSFQNTIYNSNGGSTPTSNCVFDGICQRRLEFGAKILF